MLVEPQPDLAAFLVTSRKASVFADACSSPDNAGQSLPLHVDGPRSALDRDRMAPGAKAAYVIVVPTRTLDSILEEADAPAPIDLLSIDVEGHETRSAARLRFQPLAAAADPGRGPCQQSADASLSEDERLSAHSPARPQRLVCASRRGRDGFARPSAGKSCANTILRCRFVWCAMPGAGCGGSTPTGGRDARMPRLSAIIIALNEAGNIADCLDTLSFCDERIVVDGGSTDATAQIAQGKGARVVSHPFEGFGAQKNLRCRWRPATGCCRSMPTSGVSAELWRRRSAARSRRALADAYELPRLSTFCGRLMRHSGWYPDYVLRLFRRGQGVFLRRPRA